MYLPTRLMIGTWIALAGLVSGAAVPELQRGELGFLDAVPAPRAFNTSERTPVVVNAFERVDLRLKWAVVSGSPYSTTDRIRARFRINDEKWVDLYAKRTVGNRYAQNRIYLASSKDQVANEFFGKQGDWETIRLAHFRIANWSHDELWIELVEPVKLRVVDEEEEPTTKFFKFELGE